MHSSSSASIFLRYYLPVIVVGILALVYMLSDMQTPELIAITAVILCVSPIYFLTFGQLRFVKAMHDKLVTETLNSEQEIKYEQISYVYQSALSKPAFVRINYNDPETGKTRKFYALESLSNATLLDPFNITELELTDFIRRKAQEANPQYSEASELSKWVTPFF